MKMAKKLAALATTCSMLAVTLIPSAPPAFTTEAASSYVNYAEALQKSLYLYDANMCGTGVNENSGLAWRSDCHTQDANAQVSVNGKNYTLDLSGGYHDAGDHIKFALPAGMAFTTLNLGYYKFKSAYDAAGQTAHLERLIKYETDYLRRCIIKEGSEVVGFVCQVGDNTSDSLGNADHKYWGSPESQPYTKRDIAVATLQNMSKAEVLASVCVLASSYVNFKNPADLTAAKELYDFAQKGSGNRACPFYSTGTNTEASYQSWAAAWLNKADGGNRAVNAKTTNNGWCLSWSDVWGGVGALEGKVINTSTVGGLNTSSYVVPGNSKWGSARNNFALQLEAMCNDQKWEESKWQTDFLFGNNSRNLSFMVGYGTNYPQNPHHRAACPGGTGPAAGWDADAHTPMTSAQGTKHVLVGALVGGPESSNVNDYWDSLSNYVSNEVTLDYNASMVGVLAGLMTKYGMNDKPAATNNIPEVRVIGDEWDKGGSVTEPTTPTTTPTTAPTNPTTAPTTPTTATPSNGVNTIKPNEDLVWPGGTENVKYIVPLTDLMNVNQTLTKIEVDVTAPSAMSFSGAMAISANASSWSAYDSEWMAFLKRLENASTGYALDLTAGKNTFVFEIPAAYRADVNVPYGEFQLNFWYSANSGAKVTVSEVRAYVESGSTPTTPTTVPTQPTTAPTNPTTAPTTPTTAAPTNGVNTIKPNEDLVWPGGTENVKYIVPLTDLMNVNQTLTKIEVDVNAPSAMTFSGAMAISANASSWSAYDSEWMAFLKRLENSSTGYALDLTAGKNTFVFEIPAAYRADVNVPYGEFQLNFWYSANSGAKVTVSEVRAYVENAPVTQPTTAPTTPTTAPTTPTTAPTNPTTAPTIPTTAPTGPTQTLPPPTKVGDVNGNGEINTADIILLAKFIAGRITSLTPAQQANANCDRNSSGITAEDLLALLKYMTGEVTSLPI